MVRDSFSSVRFEKPGEVKLTQGSKVEVGGEMSLSTLMLLEKGKL